MGVSGLSRLETQMLWRHVLQVERIWLITHDDYTPTEEQVARYQALAQRRLSGVPMAYILGSREFMSRSFRVTPDVLIPRPETELLVETALQHLTEHRQTAAASAVNGSYRPRVLDLGTGSGAIAVSIALACPEAAVTATDISPGALAVARENARALDARVEFFCGTWYDALLSAGQQANGVMESRHNPNTQQYDLIVSNPPYVAAADPHLAQGDVRFEPVRALTDGADGLSDLRTIVQGAGRWLRPGGALYMEHGWDQASAVRNILDEAGFCHINSTADLAGIERVTGGLYN